MQRVKSGKIIFCRSIKDVRKAKLLPSDHRICDLSDKNKKTLLDAEVGDNICDDVKSIILEYISLDW